MTADMVLATPSTATETLVLTPDERRELATKLHAEIVEVSERLARAWYEIAELLWPVFALELWRELSYAGSDGDEVPFSCFNEYAEQVVRQPVTTLRNSIYTYHQVKQLGHDPATLKDIRLSRVQDLAKVLKAYDGRPPAEIWEPLVEQARVARSRDEVAEYRQALTHHLAVVGVAADDFLRLKGESTQVSMIRDCISLAQDDLGDLGFENVSDIKALEFICANWAAMRPAQIEVTANE
jgi:hypothetical protein